MEIVWTKLALITYREVLENLNERWTKKEMVSFKNLTNALLDKIKNEQISCQVINKELDIKKGIVHKNVSLFYKIDIGEKKIYLITFFNNRMNPKTLKKLLK